MNQEGEEVKEQQPQMLQALEEQDLSKVTLFHKALENDPSELL